jgi:hypothetical protein
MANQGGYYTDSYGGGVVSRADGSRANLSGSASVPSTGGVIATVRVQGASDGLYQFGDIKEGSSYGSDCGTGDVGYMAERKAVGGTYLCNSYFGTFGQNNLFTVKRTSSTAGFEALLNGTRIDGPYTLGFPSSGIAFAVAEYNGTAPNSFSFTYGPTGGDAWAWTTNYGSTWDTVQSAPPAVKFNDGGWSIGGLPSPFTISR